MPPTEVEVITLPPPLPEEDGCGAGTPPTFKVATTGQFVSGCRLYEYDSPLTTPFRSESDLIVQCALLGICDVQVSPSYQSLGISASLDYLLLSVLLLIDEYLED